MVIPVIGGSTPVTDSEPQAESGEYATVGTNEQAVTERAEGILRGVAAKLDAELRELLTRWSSRIARRNLLLLAARGNIAETLQDIPEQMHLVARQTQLVIEFFDDFRNGRYRAMPWWAVAVAATAMLYAINPADAVPNVIPILGTMDDLAVVAVAVRILHGQLRKYCEFKGYNVSDYFR